MKRLLAALLLAPAIALAQDSAKDDGWKTFNFTLEPKKVHEECQRIEAGAKRRYAWKSDGAVDFNIHYHEGDKVHLPVKRDAMRGDGGTFTAKGADDYCWMWTAKNAPVKIEGRVEVR